MLEYIAVKDIARRETTRPSHAGDSKVKQYKKHIFVCLGKRCAAKESEELLDALKARIKAEGLKDEVIVSRSGCMRVCKETALEGEYSPVVVVYPAGVWYRNVGPADIDEIVERHVKRGEVVERLLHHVYEA